MATVELLGLSMYIWIALISLLFLVIITVMGGYGLDLGSDVDADVDMDYGEFSGPGISPLSLPLVASFGTTFGAMGALLETTDFHPGIVATGAAFSAVAVSVLLFFAVQKFLLGAQATTEVRTTELVGREAQVLIPISPGSPGQILIITAERGRTLFPAQADGEIARDSTVEIVGFVGGVANVRRKAM